CVTLLTTDYRDLKGRFDKIASVEMVEAVGHEYLPTYGECLARLVAPGGLIALQAILINERDHPRYLESVDFIQRHVFPGGYLPSLGTLAAAIDGTGRLSIRHLEDLGTHY